MREEWKLVLLPPNKDSLVEGYVTNVTSAVLGTECLPGPGTGPIATVLL